jgi:hypothetical protein
MVELVALKDSYEGEILAKNINLGNATVIHFLWKEKCPSMRHIPFTRCKNALSG